MFRLLSRQLAAWGAHEQRLASIAAPLLNPHACLASQPWLRPAAAQQQAAWMSTDAFRNHLHNASPRSLAFERESKEEQAAKAQRGFAVKALLTLGGYYSRESRHMRAAQRLYAAVTEQAVGPGFLQAMGIPPDFQQQHSSLCLHIWLLLVRLRTEGKDGKHLAQSLYDDFQSDVEKRARQAGVRVRLQKQLTELEKQFYGSSMAYDRAVAGQEDLEKALLRNVYLGRDGRQPQAQLLARYVRRELACLNMTPSEAVMTGNLKFSSDGLEAAALGASSSSSSSDSSSATAPEAAVEGGAAGSAA